MTIKKNSNLYKILRVIYKKVTQEDYDEVMVITGDEGTGKSRLMMHIVEWWNSQKGTTKPEEVDECVALDSEQFSNILQEVYKGAVRVNDEAADISSRGAMSKTNKLFMLVYQLIRGENLFTILVIPSIFDLDTFFRKRRVRHLIHVPTRGRYDFWDKQDLRRMVEMNEGKPFKNYYRVRPTARGSFSDYKGVYLERYLEKKSDKMKTVREMIGEKIGAEEAAEQEKINEEDIMVNRVVNAIRNVKGVKNET